MAELQEQTSNDQLLLQQLQNNDAAAFDTLYDKYWKLVYSAAYKRLNDENYAKDITQDIFLQLWQRRHQLTITHLPAYLYTAVRNNVLKWMEKTQRITPVPELLEQTANEGADAALLRKEFMIKYENLINTLTASQQQIFRMRYQQELSTAEIAEKLNISRKTVQNQLGKSMNNLRELLGSLFFVYQLHLYVS
ncbi:RNA polymerase sigma-70 factor (ECF subfamily) [Lacibacter cauensis]|uniref:RNA polymerase sigma-70 factor (ECF subfamily) n=1 Tax=Lacibacter cauensis TaxID=510947 RepID=A0A562SX22_9BACT|nr:sigma-70 family RNA polymerase sigma factor [Lacibacter cauensis]TWI85837.1 RNA polymerase sigma-70 factor (ECF subfamily) [Lacibacter cauensis]